MIFVGYATHHAATGARLRQVAETMARELAERGGGLCVRLREVPTHGELLREMAMIAPGTLHELHLVTPGSVYGPVLGMPAWPEQLSRHEWRQLALPFASGARAVFHFSGSGRWFAPFFAQTFGVQAVGAAAALRFSRSPERHAWVPPGHSRQAPLYLSGVLQTCSPLAPAASEAAYRGYDAVAPLYDAAFADIRVRADEWRWLAQRLSAAQPLSVIDVGCGNGALLCQLAPRLRYGLGVDVSMPMVELARRNAERRGHAERLRFEAVSAPLLPAADRSVERVLSLLSFRYLDWEPLRREVLRVLRPGGRWLIVDMVRRRCPVWQLPALASSKLRTLAAARRHPGYGPALRRLVSDAHWQRMLGEHPMRSEHEVAAYLVSRFPRGKLEVLNVGLGSRVLAFDSGPLSGRG